MKKGSSYKQNAARYNAAKENHPILMSKKAFDHLPGTSVYGEKA
jgi:hypothetical protein